MDKCNQCQTYGKQMDSAMKCETPEEAEFWMEREVAHYVEKHSKSPTEAMHIIKSNLGYMAGYYDDATAEKIHRLFYAVHPIFGSSTYHTDQSPEDAVAIGLALGEKAAGERKTDDEDPNR